MIEQTITAIKETELQAKGIAAQAEEQCAKILEDAKVKAEELKAQAVKDARAKAEDIINSAKSKGEDFTKNSDGETAEYVRKIMSDAKQKEDAAIDAAISILI